MTLLVVLMLGAGAVLILSAIQTDPATGQSVSVIQTIRNVWNNKLTPSQAGFNAGANAATAVATATPATGGAVNLTPDAYRAAIVRAYIQSQR